jgi:putative lipoprotein
MRHLHHTLESGVLLVVMAAGCGRAPEPEAEPTVVAAPEQKAEPRAAGLDLAGTEWVLETLAGELLGTDVRPTVAFDAEGRVAGNAGCNRYHGAYAVDGDAIAVGHLGATQMMCAADQMAQEDRFLDALGRADRVAMRDGLLVLRFGEPAQELVLAGVEPLPAVTGAVVYRERIALPPDAALTVRLLDVSRADAPAVVLAEQVIQPTGQVPIPFEVPYDPAQIDDEMSCTLEARIEAGGALIFVSKQAFPVITRGSPSKDLEVMVERTGG